MFKSLITMFASPLGAIVNKAIAAGSASVLSLALAHGIPADIATPVISAGFLALSFAISGLAATQGIQIPRINDDQTNGVRVVSAAKADKEGLAPVNAPLK